MERDRAYYRYQRKQHIKRKMGILRRVGGEEYLAAWSRDGEYGRLAKGKIHCSCWMCRTKSYDELCHSDWQAQVLAEEQLKEYVQFKEANEDDDFHTSGEAQQEGAGEVP